MPSSQTIESLIESLGHEEKKVSRKAADALIAMAPSAPGLRSRLEQRLSSAGRSERWPIAYVLAHIAQPSEACLEAIAEGLGAADPDMRWAAAVLLTRLAEANARISARLRELLEIGSSTQRRMAVYCLRDSDRARAHLASLLARLSDTDPLVRIAAVTSLSAYPAIDAAGISRLLALLRQDPDARVRRAAALTLGRLAPSNQEVRRELDGARRSKDPQLRKAAEAGLRAGEKKGPARCE